MPLFFVIHAAVSWLTAQIGGLAVGFETTFLEFIMLGRVPATEVYLEFEAMMVVMISLATLVIVKFLFRNPNPLA